MSLLSFLLHLVGHDKPHETVKYPDCYLQVVQITMIRLEMVTLLALHRYLGLGAKLITKQHR